MNIAGFKKYFLLLSFILVVIVTGFTGWLNLSSFHQNWRNTLMANYATMAGDTIAISNMRSGTASLWNIFTALSGFCKALRN